MTINNEAVEAAAEAIYGLGVPDLPWNERDDELRELYREDARTAIEAAAPHMLTSMARSLGEPTEEVIQLRGAVAAVLRLLEIHESKGNPTIHTHELSDVLRGSL